MGASDERLWSKSVALGMRHNSSSFKSPVAGVGDLEGSLGIRDSTGTMGVTPWRSSCSTGRNNQGGTTGCAWCGSHHSILYWGGFVCEDTSNYHCVYLWPVVVRPTFLDVESGSVTLSTLNMRNACCSQIPQSRINNACHIRPPVPTTRHKFQWHCLFKVDALAQVHPTAVPKERKFRTEGGMCD